MKFTSGLSNTLFKVLVLAIIVFASQLCLAKPLRWENFPADFKKEVVEKFPTMKTDSPSLEEIDRCLRYLMGKGSFEELQIVENENHLAFDFQLLKSIQKIVFHGMISFDSDDLMPLLQLEQGQKFDTRMVGEIREKIKNFYLEQGFLNISIDVGVNDIPGNLVELIVTVREGNPLRVKSIFLNSPNKELVARLNRLIRGSIGKIYNPSLMKNIPKEIQDYFRDHGYIRATISGPEIHMDDQKTGIDLTYRIDRPEKYKFNFEGNFLIPTPRLISALDLNILNSSDPNVLPELLTKLKEFYWRKGYAKAEISGEEKTIKKDMASQISFQINEGVPIKIESLVIEGALSQPPNYYKSFLKDHSGPTISKNLFHRNDFEQGLKNLIIDLQNSGYLKAKLISSRYLYNKTKDKISITVNLDDGPLTRIKSIRFEGLKSLSTEELLENLHLETGAALKLDQLEHGLQEMKSYCQDKGYLEFRILNEKENLVRYNEDNTEAQLHFLIEEGPLVKVNSILVDGNTLTKEFVIRKEIDFEEGDILTPSKIEESIRRLQKLSLFNSVEIKTLEQKTQIADRTVIIKVAERSPGLFNLGAGVTNERLFTLRGFAGIAYRNIRGTARAISTRAELNYNVADIQFPELKLTAGYLEPYLLNSRNKGRVNFTRAMLVDNYVNRTATDSYQLNFLLEQNLTSHILFTYDVWNISHLRDFLIKTDETITDLNLASTGPAIEFDFRDHPFNPTRGTLTRLQIEYSNPFLGNTRSIEYIKTTSSFTHYLPLQIANPFVLANSIRIGDLKNLSGADGVPYNKKGFVLGGISTIRGFEAASDERFPNNSDLGITKDQIYLLKDRAQYFLIKSELRFPIWGSVGGALFYDGGAVAVDQLKFKDPYRDAAGFGIRYATPVGPANIEFAWKLDTNRDRGESPFRMHISIGTF